LIILVFSYFNKTYLTNREGAKGAKEEKENKEEKEEVYLFYSLSVAQASCLCISVISLSLK